MDAERRIAELEARLIASERESAAKDARIAELETQVAKLMEQVATLMERLNQNSSNSHMPPSSDPPGARPGRSNKRGKGKKRKRGGQPGHKGNGRELLPEAQVDDFVHLFPPACENCWKPLAETADPWAKRYQLIELPVVKPHVTEWQRHAVTCTCCGYKTRAAYDSTIPSSPFGPRLIATVALLTGVYHLSRRRAADVLRELFGTMISLGGLSGVEARASDAVEGAVAEVWAHVERAAVKHTDGTSWRTSNVACSLWTIATAAATVFKIVVDSSKETLKPLYGALRGILVSDRATALTFWMMKRRQICWSHYADLQIMPTRVRRSLSWG